MKKLFIIIGLTKIFSISLAAQIAYGRPDILYEHRYDDYNGNDIPDWALVLFIVVIIIVIFHELKNYDPHKKKESLDQRLVRMEKEEIKYELLSKAIDKAEDPSIFDSHVYEEYEFNSNIVQDLIKNKQKKAETNIGYTKDLPKKSIQKAYSKNKLKYWVGKFDDGEIVVYDPNLQTRATDQLVVLWSYETKLSRRYFKDMARQRLKRLSDIDLRNEVLQDYCGYQQDNEQEPYPDSF